MVNLLPIHPIQQSAERTWRPWNWRSHRWRCQRWTRDIMAIFRANFQTNSDVQESFGRMSFVLFCFDLRCSNKTKRRRAQNDVFFFSSRSNLKTKKYSCSHCSPEFFSPKRHRLCCNNSSACASYHEAVACHVKVFVGPQEDADDCPTEAGLKLG